MDQSYSESDVSMSPTRILERLQVLRQLQLMQRGKLQKQRLEYQETLESSSSITEIVSHFSNSTSYNTFHGLLASPQYSSNEPSPRENNNTSKVIEEKDLIDGVSVLNLSRESEFINTSPVSSKSRTSVRSKNDNNEAESQPEAKPANKRISLDEMPILTPKQDFEALIIKNLDKEKVTEPNNPESNDIGTNKRPFLRRGEGLTRFGLNKKDLVIQNTKSLPWKRRNIGDSQNKSVTSKNRKQVQNNEIAPKTKKIQNNKTSPKKSKVEIIVTGPVIEDTKLCPPPTKPLTFTNKEKPDTEQQKKPEENAIEIDSSKCHIHFKNTLAEIKQPVQKHPVKANKGKTWAAVLTKEQDHFLQQLKPTDYYKNFASPARSTVSDMTCDESFTKLRQERELAEQNMFNLLENKVSNESFSLENSFFNKFLRNVNLECSGESTPLVMQRCLAKNPELMHLLPELNQNNDTHNETAGCNSECCHSDCYSDCESVTSCSTCKNEDTPKAPQKSKDSKNKVPNKNDQKVRIADPKGKDKSEKKLPDNTCHNDTVKEDDSLKTNMAEMNAKLAATSELLKERLRELDDEIETFRKENSNMAKLREELDLERQKFYEEKSSFESKLNEEKILSEYYLAEEKEKLSKQKQIYDKYVREMRGRLNKKEKDEVITLKNEITSLKEEIRIKDAKSTSTIARLRNQLKISDKEKKDLQDEIEKLKKENRRLQHSNEITRRLTNIKYLEEINKKLNHMSKESKSEVDLDKDVKYKAFEIERQSRSRRVQTSSKGVRPRAKSVPNLQVTSRYAKYFSQRDVISQMDRERLATECEDDNLNGTDDDDISNNSYSGENETSYRENDNHLEKLYMERFKSTSPPSNKSSPDSSRVEKSDFKSNPDQFFLRKSTSDRDSKSPSSSNTSPYFTNASLRSNLSKSPVTILSNKSNSKKLNEKSVPETESHRSKSPISILSNRSSGSRLTTVINQDNYRDKLMNVSPEPSSSKTSLSKSNLNPTEIKKPDGSRELRFPNGNVKFISSDGKYTKFVYYNGDIKENFLSEGRIKYYYADAKTIHTTHPDGLEVLEFPDGQVEKRYKDGSTEVRLPNGSTRYFDPKNEHVREEWRFPDGTTMTVAADGEQRIAFTNGQVEVHAKDHKIGFVVVVVHQTHVSRREAYPYSEDLE